MVRRVAGFRQWLAPVCPDLFWDALWQVRDCLLKDKVDWHYYRGDELFPHSVSDALLIDSWMKAMLVDDE